MSKQMELDNSRLRAHQLAMLQMLCLIDDICRRNQIPYQIFSGTALGAMRHGGFIPWDDDLDIVMLRPNYERFLSAAPKELPGEYYLQAEFSAHWPMHFSKLRKNNTSCIEKCHPRDPEMHQGIYVDIFPCDALSDHKLKRMLQFVAARLTIARSLDRRGYETDNLLKKGIIILSRMLPVRRLHRFACQAQAGHTEYVHTFFGASSKYKKSVFPRAWFQSTQQISFESRLFPISENADQLLTTLYGDWHRIPPEAERRCKVHGVIVDLEHSYTDYLEDQRKMKITEYSRSIR